MWGLCKDAHYIHHDAIGIIVVLPRHELGMCLQHWGMVLSCQDHVFQLEALTIAT